MLEKTDPPEWETFFVITVQSVDPEQGAPYINLKFHNKVYENGFSKLDNSTDNSVVKMWILPPIVSYTLSINYVSLNFLKDVVDIDLLGG